MSNISIFAFSTIWDDALRFMAQNQWGFDDRTLDELVCAADIIHADTVFCRSNGQEKPVTLSGCLWYAGFENGDIKPSDVLSERSFDLRAAAVQKYTKFKEEYSARSAFDKFDSPLFSRLNTKSKEYWQEIVRCNKPFDFIYNAGGRPIDVAEVISSYSPKMLGVVPSLFYGPFNDDSSDFIDRKTSNSPLHNIPYIS